MSFIYALHNGILLAEPPSQIVNQFSQSIQGICSSCPFAEIQQATSEEVVAPMGRISISGDGKHLVDSISKTPFRVRGFNYDHDRKGRLLEDYWNDQWTDVESDFAEMQELGANTVRIHLQFGKFMNSPTEPNEDNLVRLSALLKLAEQTRLYLDITGLGCYHRRDVPKWYDDLNEADRWEAQANFWRAITSRVQGSNAVLCLNLMNEPVVPGGKRADRDWLGPDFAGKHFVQFITLDQAGRPREEIAKAWITHLARAIREVDNERLITVGFVDWSLDRPGLTSGFVPSRVSDPLDFLCVHVYPESGKLETAKEVLKGFQIGKPLVIEECFPLRCSGEELRGFLTNEASQHNGWLSFYWGETKAELEDSKSIASAIMLQWLEQLPP